MKRIGISLVGISHLLGNQRWPISRSYLDCKDNFYEKIMSPLKDRMDVSLYLTTYDSIEKDNILNFYKPKKFEFLNLEHSHQILTFIRSLELLQQEHLDYIIITRFDIFFLNDVLKSLNFNLNNFNFLCKEKDHWDNFKFVNDCFYFLPFKYINSLITASYELYHIPPRPGLMDMHGLYTPLNNIIGNENISFLTNEPHLSSGNSIYTLKRRNQ